MKYRQNEIFINCTHCLQNTTATSFLCNVTDCIKSDIDGNNTGTGYDETPVFESNVLIIFYLASAILMLVGILGNALTCYVIINRKSMRRAIHLYTFNLAVTDLLVLVFYVPSQTVMMKNQLEWVLGEEMCKINYVILPVALHSSIGTLLAITVDRFRGLVTPFSWRCDSQRNSKILIPIIWVVSFLLSAPLFIYPRILTFADKDYCYEGFPSVKFMHWFWVSNFVIVFAIPLLVICTTQVVMVIVVVREMDNRKQNRRMITMVISLVVVFTVCTGFQHIFFFIDQFGDTSAMSLKTKALLFGVSNLVVSLQAALNPIIYGTLRNDFKKAFSRAFVIILIKMKLHKNVLNDRDKTSFTSKVLTRHFSHKHKRSPTKEYKQVGEMFQKKLELESSSVANAYFSISEPPSPQINEKFFYAPPSPRPSDGDLNFDSPRVSRGFALARNFNRFTLPVKQEPLLEQSCDAVKLLSYKEDARRTSSLHAMLYRNLHDKYSTQNTCSATSDTGYHSADDLDSEELSQEESNNEEVFYDNSKDGGGDVLDDFIQRKIHRPSVINRLKKGEETTL